MSEPTSPPEPRENGHRPHSAPPMVAKRLSTMQRLLEERRAQALVSNQFAQLDSPKACHSCNRVMGPTTSALSKHGALQFHRMLLRIRESKFHDTVFPRYDALGVTPLSLQATRAEQLNAIRVLLEEMSGLEYLGERL